MIRLRETRREKGWSQSELSRRSSVPQTVISDIENGVTKSPGIKIVVRLADALGISVNDLLERRDEIHTA